MPDPTHATQLNRAVEADDFRQLLEAARSGDVEGVKEADESLTESQENLTAAARAETDASLRGNATRLVE